MSIKKCRRCYGASNKLGILTKREGQSALEKTKSKGHPIHPWALWNMKEKISPFRELFSERIPGLPLDQKERKY